MSGDVLLVERDGDVVTWTVNRPETRNAISEDDAIDALVDAATAVNRDQSVRAVILTGAGSAFSAGGNVKDMAAAAGLFGGAPHQQRVGYREGIQRIPRAMYALEVPVIAAVNGPAVGAGCDLALMCDIRIASNTAFFAESFVKLGLIPGDGGAWLLPRAIGPARAAEMALTGDRVDAATALKWGIVSRVVEPADLLPTAREIASRIAANPPVAVRMTKKLLRESSQQTLDQLLELSATMQAVAHHTEDHREAVAAFLEKRPGRFTGA
ncbi:crotonase/enoyl-CoA hydratase family protein [Gordonia sp. LUNF6]|uniref:crotonase/enoyl-CoA hydratase family protein n=1 Tax=Gordonia TaxID=2053 RepID=UPI0005EDEDE7|nr:MULTISPECIES: crotonase/enoyl-CoA hydratase family protein [Gordonia]KJR09777.1 enoyl-CoA hydratase [Gordonia sihwensis]KXT56609.1 enoyl-CoA hydratase [Gordonia sp. QH-12]WFN94314.1 crotonase/enoyl-CoA hydratase family protein [Gordonia sihwensis]